jgi:CHAP domain/Putative peptidoglycan binding domain
MPALSFDGTILTTGTDDVTATAAAQSRLVALGYGCRTDGVFDGAMASVVRLYQAQHNDESAMPLKIDGEVGFHTWSSLFGAVSLPAQPSSPLLSQAVAVAATQVGQMEVPLGSNRGPMVDEYLRTTGINPDVGGPDDHYWCACFVYWCFVQSAKQLERSNPVVKTAGCLEHWQLAQRQPGVFEVTATAALQDRSLVRPGMIFILDFGGGEGHTGIVEALLPGGALQTIEGNTNIDGSRSGVGVFRLTRRKLSDESLKGFIDYSRT